MLSKLLIIATMVSAASAACPNSCSGHGTCSGKEVCTCYDNWGMGGSAGGDCSDRFCPYELAWVDTPSKTGALHQYAECAGKGICDRETGQCECLAGYSGKACARQTCPDDCSGHGSCTAMGDLTYGSVFNDYHDSSTAALTNIGVGSVKPTTTDAPWDADRARACVCDSGFTGINCASRMCPSGNDKMDSRLDGSDTLLQQVQKISLRMGGTDRESNYLEGTSVDKADIITYLEDYSFALTFTSKLNEKFTTKPLMIKDGWETANAFGILVASALKELPNYVIDDVTVTAEELRLKSGVGMTLLVTFTGEANHGNQNLLEVSANSCGDGCFPKITGLPYLVSPLTTVNTTSSVIQSVAADYNSYECGRRGKCDYDVGICSCFEGFTGDSCSSITALV